MCLSLCVVLQCNFAMALEDKAELEMQREITHLLSFVKHTQCKYERNGKRHNGSDAVKHIKKKYAYYQEDIGSTEAFIELSASKSSLSGQPYIIHCSGQKAISSNTWLTQELKRWRNTQVHTAADTRTTFYDISGIRNYQVTR